VAELEHIGKGQDGGPPILSDVTLTLEEGGFYFLTGASGAGKTALLNIIGLVERPRPGRLVLFDRDATSLDRSARSVLRRRIGIVFQDCWLIEELSARENVALPLRIAGAPEREIAANVAELLAWVGLAERGDRRAASLSAGERQRAAIARAIVARPELLLADDPAGHGGEEIARLLVQIFQRLNRLGTTVLIATNDLDFAGQFEHRRLHLDRGMLVEPGAAAPE